MLNLEKSGNKKAKAINKLLKNHDKLFATILTTENAFIILASCSTTSKNLILNSNEFLEADSFKSFKDIYDYQSYFVNDLEKIQKAIDGQKLNQEQLKNAKIFLITFV